MESKDKDGKIYLPNGSYYYASGTKHWFDERDKEAQKQGRTPDYKDYITGETFNRALKGLKDTKT